MMIFLSLLPANRVDNIRETRNGYFVLHSLHSQCYTTPPTPPENQQPPVTRRLHREMLPPTVNFPCAGQGTIFSPRKQLTHGCPDQKSKEYLVQDSCTLHSENALRRKLILSVLVSTAVFPTLSSYGKTKSKNPYDENRLLQQNRRVQKENNAPEDFPNFVREGFEVKVLSSDNYVKCDSGLIYRDFEVGKGDCPKDGQQVTFHYVGYNESGRRIDSTYLQGSPAKIRMGTKSLVPGFEEGIRDMRPGGKRRIIIPPELGPPVGPSTFFSAKQFEVFDVELLSIQNCERRTIAFYSDVICN